MHKVRSVNGFTLIELLLVLAIIGVVTAVTLPSMVKSIKGNRLRSASRIVVMAGRYARSMAVIKQKEMSVNFDLNSGKVSVGNELSRDLDGIHIEYIEVKGVNKYTKNKCSVKYQSNGRCVPYTVKIVDKMGVSVIIDVDALSSAHTEKES